MPKILVLYNPPTNPAAFDKYYRDIHVPLAKKIAKVRSYTISTSPPTVLAGNPVHLVAELSFDSMEDLGIGLASAEGQATAADLANFADGGATILIFDASNV
jgi:uncharacterized protein (TIGR02118 family)